MTRLLIFCCFLLFVAATCEREVDLDLAPVEPKLAVYSSFTPSMEMRVFVSKANDFARPSVVDYIEDAEVEIFIGEDFIERFTLVEDVDEPYFTSEDFQPEIDVTYTIKVSAEGFNTVMAKSSIPRPVEISALQIQDLQITPGEIDGNLDYEYTVLLTFFDPADEVNYYQLNFFQQVYGVQIIEGDTIIMDSELEPVSFNSLFNDNFSNALDQGGILFKDDEFDGNGITNSFVLSKTINTNNQKLGLMYAELLSVSSEYYEFQNARNRDENNQGPPFSAPVTTFNNIENGLGIFAGYAGVMDSIAVIN